MSLYVPITICTNEKRYATNLSLHQDISGSSISNHLPAQLTIAISKFALRSQNVLKTYSHSPFPPALPHDHNPIETCFTLRTHSERHGSSKQQSSTEHHAPPRPISAMRTQTCLLAAAVPHSSPAFESQLQTCRSSRRCPRTPTWLWGVESLSCQLRHGGACSHVADSMRDWLSM